MGNDSCFCTERGVKLENVMTSVVLNSEFSFEAVNFSVSMEEKFLPTRFRYVQYSVEL